MAKTPLELMEKLQCRYSGQGSAPGWTRFCYKWPSSSITGSSVAIPC